MITPWTIYWIGILDSISCVLTLLAFLFGIIAIPCGIAWMVESDFHEEKARVAKKATACMFFCCLIFCLTNAFIPSTRLAAAMYIVPAVANNEDVKAIGGNSLKALRKLSEEWLLELAGEENEDKKEKKGESI